VILAPGPGGAPEEEGLDRATWARIRTEASREGPRNFTGHCGGAPLSPHAVWGNGDRRVFRCARHASGDSAAWARRWSGADLGRALGGPVTALEVTSPDGVWTLRVRAGGRAHELRYDEAHRRLAVTLGWDALPSPADRIVPEGNGFRAEGVGRGHRVGLCLGD
jgi:YD repeat-containing protein